MRPLGLKPPVCSIRSPFCLLLSAIRTVIRQTRFSAAEHGPRRVVGAGLALVLAVALGVGVADLRAEPTLGGMSVLSEFGEPLRAEIEIRDVPAADADSIDAAIGSREDYARLGLPYPAALEGALVRIQRRPGGVVTVRIATRGPVADAELNMVLVLSGRFGRYLRNYQLSAPASAPVAVSPVPAPAVPAVSASASGGSPGADAAADANPRRLDLTPLPGRAAEPEPAPSAEPSSSQTPAAPASLPPISPVTPAAAATAPTQPDARSASAAPSGRTLRVRPGDTASTLARQFKPADVSDRQAVMALYRRNQAVFGGSPDRLAAGVLLQVPDDAELRAAPRHEATVAVKPSTPVRAAGTPPADRLVLSGDGGKAAGPGRLGSDKAAKAAALEAARAEADSRVRELQKNVDDLNRLLEIRDRQLARLQENAQRRPGESAASPGGNGMTPVSAGGAGPGSAVIPAPGSAVVGAVAPAGGPAANPPSPSAGGEPAAPPAAAPAVTAAPVPAPTPVAAKAPEPADDDYGSLLADWRVQAAAGLLAAMVVLTGVMLTLRSTKPGGKRSLTARDGPPAAQRSKKPRGPVAAR